MTTDTLISRLRGLRRSRGGWIARCPAHEDRSPSLSVGNGRDGRVLLHCHAGCTPEAVCGALDIRMGQLFARAGERPKPVPHIVREAQCHIAGLRSRLTPKDREAGVTVVAARQDTLDTAIARALALAVEGELVQVAFSQDEQ